MRVVIDADAEQKARDSVIPWLEDDLGPEITERARRYAPKETGALAASCEHHMDGDTLVVSAWGGQDGRSYAAYIELGHRVYHPSTGIVGPEWVPGVHFLKSALYDSGMHLAAKFYRADKIMQARLEQARAAERTRRAQEYQRDLHEGLRNLTEEQRARGRAADARHRASAERNRTEDKRTFTRDPRTGEKIFMDEAARAKKEREAAWFAEQWRLKHPGAPRDNAPPF